MEFSLFYFLFALLFSLVTIYIISDNAKIIVKYPNIEDKISDLYVDDNNICYRYHRKEVDCNRKN